MVRTAVNRLKHGARLALNHALPVPGPDVVRVRHGSGEGSGGPNVKLARMSRYWPDVRWRYNLIYSVSGRVSAAECRLARRRDVPVVAHVNSLFHAAYRPDWEALNVPARAVYELTDHVVFGSDFARAAADHFWGPPPDGWTRIYNGLDVTHFRPLERPPDRFHILTAGVQYLRHRLEALIRALPHVLAERPDARLLVAGPLRPGEGAFDCGPETIGHIVAEVGVAEHVGFLGPYTQADAPGVLALGDVFVNLKHMDWTPNAVAEAMACGLPVVHSGNGGTGELTGASGIGLAVPADWDAVHTPDPEAVAAAILTAWRERAERGALARQIAVERFSLESWRGAHAALFEKLLREH